MAEVYIIESVRTPIGIGKPEVGDLYPMAPMDLAALVLSEVLARAGIGPEAVEDVLLGCVTPVGDQGANIARLAVLKAGFPVSVPGIQLNRMCGSGQQALHSAAQTILAGDADLVIAGGVEMMSHQPIGADWPAQWPADFPFPLVHQGYSAELMAEKWNLGREALDEFSFQSHVRAGEAIERGRLADQILPVSIPMDGNGTSRVIELDQGVRMPPDRDKMAALKPAFKEDGVITAGNSSQISDGAAAVLLASERAVQRHKLQPQAKMLARVVVGSDPVLMLDGPIAATQVALERVGLAITDLDWIEINEAFASVVLAWQREVEADWKVVNPDGGAIAHGHPLGATGAILMTKLVHGLRQSGGQHGLQTMCIGHGMATATVIEAVG